MNTKQYKKMITNEYILALKQSISNPSSVAEDRLKEASKKINRSIKITQKRRQK